MSRLESSTSLSCIYHGTISAWDTIDYACGFLDRSFVLWMNQMLTKCLVWSYCSGYPMSSEHTIHCLRHTPHVWYGYHNLLLSITFLLLLSSLLRLLVCFSLVHPLSHIFEGPIGISTHSEGIFDMDYLLFLIFWLHYDIVGSVKEGLSCNICTIATIIRSCYIIVQPCCTLVRSWHYVTTPNTNPWSRKVHRQMYNPQDMCITHFCYNIATRWMLAPSFLPHCVGRCWRKAAGFFDVEVYFDI